MPVIGGDLNGSSALVLTGLPGLKTTEANPVIMEGSFWVWLQPLMLLRSRFYVEEGSCCFDSWTPKNFNESGMCAMLPLQPHFARYLWFNKLWPDPTMSEQGSITAKVLIERDGHHYKAGDVILAEDHQRLWFVGPETTDKQIHVLADWPVVNITLPRGNVYQPGPPGPGELTRLERVAKGRYSEP